MVTLFSEKTEKYACGREGLRTVRIDDRENSLNFQFGYRNLSQGVEFEFFPDGSAGDKPHSQTGFHCGLDRLGGVKLHSDACMFHLNTSGLKSCFDNPARS